MRKILKYLMIIFISGYIFNKLLFFGLTYLYFHGSVSPPSKMKVYEFNTSVMKFKNELKIISDKSIYLVYKDSIFEESKINTIRMFKNGEKLTYYLEVNEKRNDKDKLVELSLYFINGKGKNDFGWFSNEKNRQIKLFEENIIEPLSKKFEKIEVE